MIGYALVRAFLRTWGVVPTTEPSGTEPSAAATAGSRDIRLSGGAAREPVGPQTQPDLGGWVSDASGLSCPRCYPCLLYTSPSPRD